ncbi:hypothetical protein QBC43DRAFT_355331 [Cladorrhinum sp. PSN259]|nr:hypothetical protein QBC43DRAFT_355331 [Cladorrhinum sp. PSN259]
MATTTPSQNSLTATSPTSLSPTAFSTSASSSEPAVRIPLTTTFTPPPKCKYDGIPTQVGNWLRVNEILDWWENQGIPPAHDCYPASFPSAVYSPGLCPSGYEGFRGHPDFDWYTYYTWGHDLTLETLLPNEHKALCCLSGFTPDSQPLTNLPQKCYSYPGYTGGDPFTKHTMTYLTYDEAHSSFATVSAVTELLVQHPGIRIMWRDGDFPDGVDPAPPRPTTTTTTTTSPDLPTATGSDQHKKELSKDAKAGIGIGAGIGGICICLGVFLFLKHRKRRRRRSSGRTFEDTTSRKEDTELEQQPAQAI